MFYGFVFFSVNVIQAKEADTFSRQAEIFFPSYSWAKFNENHDISGYKGINLLLGYSSKNYFSVLKSNAFNPFWELNTLLLILPHVSIGTEYIWDNGFYFNIKYSYGMQGISYDERSNGDVFINGWPMIGLGFKF